MAIASFSCNSSLLWKGIPSSILIRDKISFELQYRFGLKSALSSALVRFPKLQGDIMSPKVSPIPQGYHTITPHIVVNDTRKAADFYKRAFGAEVRPMATGPDGV